MCIWTSGFTKATLGLKVYTGVLVFQDNDDDGDDAEREREGLFENV